MNQQMCATHDELPRDTSSTPTTANQKTVETRPILRQPSDYKKYKHNRISSIVDMTNNHERTETFKEGTCFYLVGDRRPITTKVLATLVENGVSKPVVTTVCNLNVTSTSLSRVYGIPLHNDCTRCYEHSLTKEIHVSTKECSVSSGVCSGESSELDSPVPRSSSSNIQPTYTRSLLTAKKQHQNTDKPILNSCSVTANTRLYKPRSSLNSSLNSPSRRDSGFSSPSSPNFVNNSPLSKVTPESLVTTTKKRSPTCSQCAGMSNRGRVTHNINYEKEALLTHIKRNLYDPEKEIYMQEIKKVLRTTGQQTFANQVSSSPWRPIKQLHSAPLRGVLKYNPSKLLEEIQTRHNMKALERARKERNMLCPLKRSDVVDIIKQVQKCLSITQQHKTGTNSPLQCKFQIHRKVKLKSFTNGNEENNRIPTNNSNRVKNSTLANIYGNKKNENERRLSTGYSEHLDYFTGQLQQAASHGDIKRILEVINSNPTVLRDTQGRGWPALHQAFKKQHYRTAVLLFEAGTNLEVYTKQRVQEYHHMMEVISRNKKLLLKSSS